MYLISIVYYIKLYKIAEKAYFQLMIFHTHECILLVTIMYRFAVRA